MKKNPVCWLTICSRSNLRFVLSVPFLDPVNATGSLLCPQTPSPAFANESNLYVHTMFQIYTSLRIFCTFTRLCETQSLITVLRETTTGFCIWIHSVGSHYVPDLYFASEGLFPSSPLWNPQVSNCAHSTNHRLLQMNPVYRTTQSSRPIHLCVSSVPFLASGKP
jgi:hypothetical protein